MQNATVYKLGKYGVCADVCGQAGGAAEMFVESCHAYSEQILHD